MLLVIFICFSILYSDAFISLWDEWFSEGSAYSHGPLVFGVSLYLVWIKRYEISLITPSLSTWMVLLFLLASLPVWVVASALSIETLKHVYVIVMLALLVWGVMGWRVVWAVMFPIGYLFFAVPIWAVLEPSMQHITAWSSGVILHLIGIPVLKEGLFLSIPAGVFEVEGGCSGVNYLISGLALSVFYSFISFRSYWKRSIFILTAIGLTIVGNIIRVVIIIVAGHLTEMQHSFVTDHSAMGWWVFLLIMIPLYIVGFRYQEPEPAAWNSAGKSLGFPVFSVNRKILISIIPFVIVLGLGPLMASAVDKSMGHELVDRGAVMPDLELIKWQRTEPVAWRPAFATADLELLQTYKGTDSSKVFSYLSYYARQGKDKELAAGTNSLADGVEWFSKQGFAGRVIDSSGTPGQVREEYIVNKSGLKRYLVWYWYSVAGHETTQRKRAKLLEFYKLIEPNKGSALMLVAAEVVNGDVKHARHQLGVFHRDVSPGLEQYIDRLGSQ